MPLQKSIPTSVFSNATFAVANNVSALTFNPGSLNITAEENGIPVGQAATRVVSADMLRYECRDTVWGCS